jgi:hypothetical protein
MFKIGFITNWIITLQILSLCLSQVNIEFCIKCGCKVVTSGWQGSFGIEYDKICICVWYTIKHGTAHNPTLHILQ